jgi:peptidoglycan/xylan/chitin deacetylase (PgdA/CDA1 family)
MLGGLADVGRREPEQAAERARNAQQSAVREADGVTAVIGPPGRFGQRRVVWSTTASGPLAAISFDDGPMPEYTPRILAALDRAGVRATFFVMGHNAVAHPELLRETVAAGHEIGNHSWSHLDQTQISQPRIREEIVRCTHEVEQLIQRPLVGFRPPRGELTGYAVMVASQLGHDVFMWSCTRGPAGTSTVPVVARSIGTTVEAGDVLDLHDGLGRGVFSPGTSSTRDLAARREVEVRALPEALSRIADRGIELTSVTDLLARSVPEPLPAWAGRTLPAH